MAASVILTACALFVASVVCDLRSRRIPNAIPLALLALFVLHAVLAGGGAGGSPRADFMLGAVFLVAGFTLHLGGWMGAGDGKLMAVAGAWVGMDGLVQFLAGLAAASFTLCLFALLPFDRTRRMRRNLPFAVAIAPPAIVAVIPRAFAHGIAV